MTHCATVCVCVGLEKPGKCRARLLNTTFYPGQTFDPRNPNTPYSNSAQRETQMSNAVNTTGGEFDIMRMLELSGAEEDRQQWKTYLSSRFRSKNLIVQFGEVLESEDWPSERLTAAEDLHARFRQLVEPIKDNNIKSATLFDNYFLAQTVVTPVHRLPEETFAEIIRIAVSEHGQKPHHLIRVCRRWWLIITRLPHLWSSLRILPWTNGEYVKRSLARAGKGNLDVIMHVGEGNISDFGDTEPYEGASIAAESAERWQSLVLSALSTNKDPSPMKGYPDTAPPSHASSLKTCLSKIASSAQRLKRLEINDSYCLSHFSHPIHNQVLWGLTDLRVHVPGGGGVVNILPSLPSITRLDLSHVMLPDYTLSADLPFIEHLVYLSLAVVSVQWMAGREFKVLRTCSIQSPLNHRAIQGTRIVLPVCGELAYQAYPLEGLSAFVAPQLTVLNTGINSFNALRNAAELDRVRNFCAHQTTLQHIHLTVEGHDLSLIGILKLLPGLRELVLNLDRPLSLGWKFFRALIANSHKSRPRHQLEWWSSMFNDDDDDDSSPLLCASLTFLGLRYGRWLRNTETEIIVPLFAAILHSRKLAGVPLSSFTIEWGRGMVPTWINIWRAIFEKPPRYALGTSGFRDIWMIHEAFTSATRSDFIMLVDVLPHTVLYLAQPLYSPHMRQITTLTISINGLWRGSEADILPYCEQLEQLDITGVSMPRYSNKTDLPLVRTLYKVIVTGSSIDWMGGRTFLKLTECKIRDIPDPKWRGPLWVSLPVCRVMEHWNMTLDLLPHFLLPSLQSLLVGPIPVRLPNSLGQHERNDGPLWSLYFRFPIPRMSTKEALLLISHLRMLGSSLLWPMGANAPHMEANLLEKRLLPSKEYFMAIGVSLHMFYNKDYSHWEEAYFYG